MQEKIERDCAAGVEEQIGEMKAEGIRIPEKVINDEGKVLHRPIMPRERIGKEMMPKDFERKKGTLDERTVAREKRIVPDELPG